MARKRSLRKIPAVVKAVLIVALLYILWRLPLSDQILSALFGLLFAGAVPGTHIILSPEMTMRVAVIGAGGLVVLLLMAGFVSRWRKNRALNRLLAESEPVEAPKRTEPVPVIMASKVSKARGVKSKQAAVDPVVVKIRLPRKPSKTRLWLRALLRLAPPAISVFVRWVLKFVGGIILGLSKRARSAITLFGRGLCELGRGAYVIWLQVIHGLSILGGMIYKGTRLVVVAILRMVSGIVLTSITASIVVWEWAAPHLWRLDGWLERQTRRTLKTIHTKVHSSENVHFSITLVQQSIKQFKPAKPVEPQPTPSVKSKRRKS